MNQKVAITPLFPIAVGCFEFGDYTDDEINYINNLEKVTNLKNYRTKKQDLHYHKKLKRIFDFINKSLKNYVDTVYEPKTSVVPYITNSWANYNERGMSHHKHRHSNSFLSGVLYIETDPEDSIEFFNDNFDLFELETKDFNIFNSGSWKFPALRGQLLIFPSNIYHQVPIHTTETTRVSLSFNTYLKGRIGICGQGSDFVL